MLSSMEPSIAVQICKTEKPDRIFEFMAELHKDIYISGLNTAIPADYERLAKKMGFDSEKFINDIQSDNYIRRTEQDFEKASALGIDSYPAVLIRNKEVTKVISRGYIDWGGFNDLLKLELVR